MTPLLPEWPVGGAKETPRRSGSKVGPNLPRRARARGGAFVPALRGHAPPRGDHAPREITSCPRGFSALFLLGRRRACFPPLRRARLEVLETVCGSDRDPGVDAPERPAPARPAPSQPRSALLGELQGARGVRAGRLLRGQRAARRRRRDAGGAGQGLGGKRRGYEGGRGCGGRAGLPPASFSGRPRPWGSLTPPSQARRRGQSRRRRTRAAF